MRTEILIAIAVGSFFFFTSAIVAALAIKYATNSRLWDIFLMIGIAGMICSVVTLALFVNSQNKELLFLWPAVLTNIGICLVVAGVGWHFSSIEMSQARKPNDMPVSFTLRQTSFITGRAGLDENLADDALAFVFGPVFVVNTSKTDRVILDFTLLVNGSDGTHLKILSGVRDSIGRIYGQKVAETLRKNDLEVPIYLISPVEIEPQKPMQGKLAFVYGPVGEGPMTEFVKNSFSHNYEYTLVISDRISATSVELKMPWEYPTH